MKRALSLLLVSALSLSLLAGCSAAEQLSAEPISLTAQELSAHGPDTQNACDALSAFGLELLRNTKQAGESTLLSPLSVILALSMATNGAEGETMAQFQETMGGVSLEALNAACQSLLSDYRQLGGSTRASIANSLWVDPEGQISGEFTGRCMGIYGAEVFQGELSSSGIVNDVNRWVSKQTKGLIPELVQQPFPEDTAALLVNALYLRNTWELEFDPISTYPRKFTHSSGQVEQMDFLHHSTDLLYLQGEGAQGVVLPYDDGRLAFAAILPDSPDLGGWPDSLNGNALSQLVQGADEQRFLHLAFPKFEAEWSGSLQEILKDMGLEDAFTPGQADFSRMGDHPNGYYLSEVIHAAKLQVNEKGTEAAAATLVAAGDGAAPPPAEGIKLLLDRPFPYGIFDRQNGIPLFLGTFE